MYRDFAVLKIVIIGGLFQECFVRFHGDLFDWDK